MLEGINFMRKYVGLREIKDKEQLMQLLKSQAIKGDIAINPAETPWCAASMTMCERMAGKKVNLKNPLAARSFLEYGRHIELKDAKIGDILIFERGTNNVFGHVTYLDAFHSDHLGSIHDTVTVVGGNQNDSICFETRSLDRLIGIRRNDL